MSSDVAFEEESVSQEKPRRDKPCSVCGARQRKDDRRVRLCRTATGSTAGRWQWAAEGVVSSQGTFYLGSRALSVTACTLTRLL